MEGNVVSSSSMSIQTRESQKLNCDPWSDELYSNISYTKPWYRAEIKKISSEISKLEANLEEGKELFSTANLNDVLSKLMHKLPKDKQASLEGLDNRGKLHEDGEVDIKRLERFTGLSVHHVSLTDEQEKAGVCIRRHQVHGICRGIKFETSFLVEENTDQDDRHDNSRGTKTKRIILCQDLKVTLPCQILIQYGCYDLAITIAK